MASFRKTLLKLMSVRSHEEILCLSWEISNAISIFLEVMKTLKMAKI